MANSISLTTGRSIYLEVNIPQPIVEEPDQKTSPLGRWFPILMASPLKTTSPRTEREVSITVEGKQSPVLGNIRHIWSCVRKLNPKKAKPCGHPHTSTS